MDNELLLFDRLQVIQATNQKYDLEHNAYLSFSGGKDSTILHYLLDMALPNNRIPRVFIDTGIEYTKIREFVMGLAKNDNRFIIIKPSKPIKPVLDTYGYPFKSKEFARRVYDFKSVKKKNSLDKYIKMSVEEYATYMLEHKEENKNLIGNGIFILDYLHNVRSVRDKNGYLIKFQVATKFACPEKLRYLFLEDTNFKINNTCCLKLKKEPAHKFEKESGRKIVLTGMRKDEGGQRANIKGCVITDNNGNVVKFHPLLVVSDEWEEWFVSNTERERERVEYSANFTTHLIILREQVVRGVPLR